MAKDDTPGRPPVRRTISLNGHQPRRAQVIQTRGYQPVIPVSRSLDHGLSSQGGRQPTNEGTTAQVPSNPPNQGTSGKK